jgi:hypothetical protein
MRVRVLLTFLLVPAFADAQSTSERSALIALRGTPIGSLSPIMTPAMVSRRLNGAQLGIRYGLRDEGNVRSQAVAGSVIVGLGLESSASLTAGVIDADCLNCSPDLMLGLAGDMRVFERGDVAASGSSFSIAISGDLGYGRPEEAEHVISLGVGAPMTLSFGATPEGMRIAPFFTPVFGIGSISAPCPVLLPCENSGTRFVLGGGIGFWNPISSISASIGVNHVMTDGAQPLFGVNVLIGGR